MESKFRPIPLTILDFMGALLPGFVWLLLIFTTFHVLLDDGRPRTPPPLAAWQDIISLTAKTDALLAAFLLTVVSLLIGYIMKPLAMGVAGALAKYLPKIDREARHVRPFDFPFNAYFKGKFKGERGPHDSGGTQEPPNFYDEVVRLLSERLPCSPERLPGNAPFGAAKRYLRLAAPTLWEESERMEAEVRMVGMMFLAALYSLILSVVVLVMPSQGGGVAQTLCWSVASLVAAALFVAGFNRARIREVGYTYVNTLIAMCCSTHPPAPAGRAWGRSDDDGE